MTLLVTLLNKGQERENSLIYITKKFYVNSIYLFRGGDVQGVQDCTTAGIYQINMRKSNTFFLYSAGRGQSWISWISWIGSVTQPTMLAHNKE